MLKLAGNPALKQAHGGRKRRAGRVRTDPRSVKRNRPLSTRVIEVTAVDNLAANGIDSRSFRVDLREQSRIEGDEHRAGLVVAPHSDAIGSGATRTAIQ